MHIEIESAANFLSNLLRLQDDRFSDRNSESGKGSPHLKLTTEQLEDFKQSVIKHLKNHYLHHWFPEMPFKGSGYRCLRINHKMDPVIALAGRYCGLDDSILKNLFPEELTMWIDPNEVSYRIGENGSICVLYDADNQDPNNSNFNNSVSNSASNSSFNSIFSNSSQFNSQRITPSPSNSSLLSSPASTSSLSSPSSSPPTWYNYNLNCNSGLNSGHQFFRSSNQSPPHYLAKNLINQFI